MKVFIGGARQIRTLNNCVIEKLDNILNKEFEILVGDASGIDEQIQKYYFAKQYRSVRIYASNGKVRHNVGNWDVECVNVPEKIKGFEFYAAKDLQMARDADYGFMIWNGKSKGTWNNVINLTNMNKTVVLYVSSCKQIFKLANAGDVEKFMMYINKSSSDLSNLSICRDGEQLRLF